MFGSNVQPRRRVREKPAEWRCKCSEIVNHPFTKVDPDPRVQAAYTEYLRARDDSFKGPVSGTYGTVSIPLEQFKTRPGWLTRCPDCNTDRPR